MVTPGWSHLMPRTQTIHLLFVSWPLVHFWLRYSKFNISHWKIKVKIIAKVKPDDHIWGLKFNQYVCILFCGNLTIFGWDIVNFIFDLENSRSRLLPRSNLMATFEAWGSIDNMSAFCSVSIWQFLPEIQQIPYLTLKILGQGHDQNFSGNI